MRIINTTMKKLYILAFLLVSLTMSGQQDPQYTQYMYNMAVLNPAYAGSKETISTGILYRDQWSGVSGAPITKTFFGHSPMGNNVGLGLSVISDEIGPVQETNSYVDFSYNIKLGGQHNLAFGLKAGATFHNIGLTGLDGVDPNDPLFSQDINKVSPNLGGGVFYYTNKFYFSASVPNMIETYFIQDGDDEYQFGSERMHLFVTSGYVFNLSDGIKFKPSFMLKLLSPLNPEAKAPYDKLRLTVPKSYDLNANFLFYDVLELGVSYRNADSWSGLVNFAITPNLRVGYAYDAVTSNIKQFAPASHEFILLFDLDLGRRVSRSPRFF
jgi:type IX secretion system PorP/SprF family membrane protein